MHSLHELHNGDICLSVCLSVVRISHIRNYSMDFDEIWRWETADVESVSLLLSLLYDPQFT